MKKLLIAMFLILLVCSTAYAFFMNSEADISRKIEAANYCEKTSDCVSEGFGYPFGCWDFVNKNEVEGLKKHIKDAEIELCMYQCSIQKLQDNLPICENKKCVAASPENIDKVFESYSCEEIQPVIKNQLEVRSYCEKDSDCVILDGSKGFSCKVLASEYPDNTQIKNYERYAEKCGQQDYKKCIIPQKTACIDHVCKIVK